ncbi:MAG: hypothetical protein ABIS67_13450 [Candidatus Eisenbacteria bacterium]
MSKRHPGERRSGQGRPAISEATGTARNSSPGFTEPASWWLWAGLLALVVTRAVLTFVPGTALWGMHQQRFLAPALAWVPWLLAAVVLMPQAARPFTALLAAFGGAIERSPGRLTLAVAAAATALVFALPDRLFFVGDFLLRMGAVQGEESPAVLSPQAFPLDVFLHYTVPLGAINAKWLDAPAAARVIGAFDAALLAAAGVLLARALAVGPAARAAAFAVAFFGGYLCLMTGESKAFAEMVVVVVGFTGFSLMALRNAGGGGDPAQESRPAGRFQGTWALLGAGLCLSAGVFLHRLTLGLIPAWLVLIVFWLRAGGWNTLRSLPALVGLGGPVTCLAVMAPRLWSTALAYDLGANFSTAEVRGPGGVLGAAFAPAHLLDVVNLLLFLSPLALVALLLAIPRPRRAVAASGPRRARPDAVLLAALVVPYGVVLLLLQPPQGPLRDWEAYAASAAAISAAAAWTISRVIERTRQAWLAAAVVLGVATPTVQWLAHFSDESRGLARLEALMTGPPLRSAVDRATNWDFIGWARFRDEQYDRSALAFEQASHAAPSPRHLTNWAMAETMLGRQERAFELYASAVERDSNYRMGWFGVGVSAINSGRPAEARRAVRALERLDPNNPKTVELVEWLRRWEAAEGR